MLPPSKYADVVIIGVANVVPEFIRRVTVRLDAKGLCCLNADKNEIRDLVKEMLPTIIRQAGFLSMIASDNGVDPEVARTDPSRPQRVKRANELKAVNPGYLVEQIMRSDSSYGLEPLSKESNADGYSERQRVQMAQKDRGKYLVDLITEAVCARMSDSLDATTRELIDANMAALRKSLCESVSSGARHPDRLEEINSRREETMAEIKRKAREHARKKSGDR